MKGITPFLWFDDEAEEAVDFYLSVFPRGRKGKVFRSAGKVLTAEFEVQGQSFVALNGGPQFPFTEAVSFVVSCESQAEIDDLWERLSEGGKKVQCGWLKDRYGLSWQIVPADLPEILGGADPAKSKAAFDALMKMEKIVVEDLRRARDAA